MTFKRDFNGIVLHLLHQLVKDTLHFVEIVSGSAADLTHIDVKVEELQSNVQDYGITDLKAFFTSTEFTRANFELDEHFRNMRGTSFSNVAVSLNSSDSTPCEGVELVDIDFTYTGNNIVDKSLTSACYNAKATFKGK